MQVSSIWITQIVCSSKWSSDQIYYEIPLHKLECDQTIIQLSVKFHEACIFAWSIDEKVKLFPWFYSSKELVKISALCIPQIEKGQKLKQLKNQVTAMIQGSLSVNISAMSFCSVKITFCIKLSSGMLKIFLDTDIYPLWSNFGQPLQIWEK